MFSELPSLRGPRVSLTGGECGSNQDTQCQLVALHCFVLVVRETSYGWRAAAQPGTGVLRWGGRPGPGRPPDEHHDPHGGASFRAESGPWQISTCVARTVLQEFGPNEGCIRRRRGGFRACRPRHRPQGSCWGAVRSSSSWSGRRREKGGPDWTGRLGGGGLEGSPGWQVLLRSSGGCSPPVREATTVPRRPRRRPPPSPAPR